MNMTRRGLLSLAGMGSVLGMAACKRQRLQEEQPAPTEAPTSEPEEPKIDLNEFDQLTIDMAAWHYDEDLDCYYQLSLPYCIKAESGPYESLCIFVPGAYFEGKKRGDLFECTIAEQGKVGAYTPFTAPVAMPLNSPDCEAQECPATYAPAGLGRYLKAGIVYVYPGFRGRSGGYESSSNAYFAGGAPWPVVDLKAAVRYLRYNEKALPIDGKKVFLFGMGAAGGVASVMGTSGNAPEYAPYLEAIGAATHDVEGNGLTDDVAGIATWCPVESYASADAAYEWMMGRHASEGTRSDGTWTKLLSHDLCESYGDFVNVLGLTDEAGKTLTLERIEDGSYSVGSYNEHLLAEVEAAAKDFFARTRFPYTTVPVEEGVRMFPGSPALAVSEPAEEQAAVQDGADKKEQADLTGDASQKAQADQKDGNQQKVQAEQGDDADKKDVVAPSNQVAQGDDANKKDLVAAASVASTSGVRQVQATVYDTIEGYLATLNGADRWITYNASTGDVDITGLWGFVTACRKPDQDVCAYDRIDKSGTANQLFGTADKSSLHFDPMVSKLVEENRERYAKAKDWKDEYVSDWHGDLAEVDMFETTVGDRVSLFDPMALLAKKGEEGQAPAVAPHWRINTGLFQTRTTLVGELNLARMLAAREGVHDVSFESVWGAGFDLAEREGDPEDNLVAWIGACTETH